MEYPVFVNVRDRLCVVVGGGPVGRRKAEGLLAAGARVRLVSPCAEASPPGVEVVSREYRTGDLHGAFLVFAATGDRAVNAAVAVEARRAGVPVNVADVPEEGDFSLPARFFRGDLCVAVSTNGKSPAFAVWLKEYLAAAIGEEWEVFLDIAAAIRQKRLREKGRSGSGERVFGRLLEKDLPALISCRNTLKIDTALEEVLGPGYSLSGLGVSLPPDR